MEFYRTSYGLFQDDWRGEALDGSPRECCSCCSEVTHFAGGECAFITLSVINRGTLIMAISPARAAQLQPPQKLFAPLVDAPFAIP